MASGLAFDCWLSLLEVQTFDVRQRESYELLGCSSVWILSLALPYLPCPPLPPPPPGSLLAPLCVFVWPVLCALHHDHHVQMSLPPFLDTRTHTHTHKSHAHAAPSQPLIIFFYAFIR